MHRMKPFDPKSPTWKPNFDRACPKRCSSRYYSWSLHQRIAYYTKKTEEKFSKNSGPRLPGNVVQQFFVSIRNITIYLFDLKFFLFFPNSLFSTINCYEDTRLRHDKMVVSEKIYRSSIVVQKFLVCEVNSSKSLNIKISSELFPSAPFKKPENGI